MSKYLASSYALEQCLSILSPNVSSPRLLRKAFCGERQPPVFLNNPLRSLIIYAIGPNFKYGLSPGYFSLSNLNFPLKVSIPLIASLLPLMYFDDELTTTSAPRVIGCIRYGVDTVLSTISGIPCACATSATALISVTSSLGLPIVSANTTLVLSVISSSKHSGLLSATYFTVMPKLSRSSNSSTVPPYNPHEATTSSPCLTILAIELNIAAIPEEHATLENPSSSLVILFSNASIVGLLILVYENPIALLSNILSSSSALSCLNALD